METSAPESSLELHVIPALQDNYIYLARDFKRNIRFVVDPGEASGVLKRLKELNWKLDYILNTHHHADHTGGNLELKNKTGALVIGSEADAHRLPGLDLAVSEKSSPSLGCDLFFELLEIPGHTTGHVAFFFPEGSELFCGDTLFLSGCGALFEGSSEQMLSSLKKLRSLPLRTKIYCGHEYSLSNTKFALKYDPDNLQLKDKLLKFEELRKQGCMTVPGTLENEMLTNPFLRAHLPPFREKLGLSPTASELECFTELRLKKNHDRG